MYETSGHFPYYRDSQFAPLFGSEVGGMLDAWSERLQEGTLDSDGEDKLMAAAEVFGVKLLITAHQHRPIRNESVACLAEGTMSVICSNR